MPRGWPTPVNQRLRRAQHELHSVCDQIVAHRRASGGRQEDLLGLLLEAREEGSSLTDGEVRDQVLIFLLAGHETTSTALTYALHLLGRHPGAQHRVRAEAGMIAGERALTAQDVPALGYTTMVLKEAMRLYPPGPFLGRLAVQDDQIGGYHIPAGADVVLAPWITHRSARRRTASASGSTVRCTTGSACRRSSPNRMRPTVANVRPVISL